jgi:hypothetical protein
VWWWRIITSSMYQPLETHLFSRSYEKGFSKRSMKNVFFQVIQS